MLKQKRMEGREVTKRFLGLTLKHWLWILLAIPGLPFALGSLYILGYSNIPWPVEGRVHIAPVRNETDELIILVHGKGDNPSSWAEGFAGELRKSILNDRQQVVTVDWEKYSGDLFRSTLNARRIGHDLGKRISRQNNLKKIHLIGHSAGSFLVYGICETVKKDNGRLLVHATYLDPVSIYGGIDWRYGIRNFGRCADISDAYIDHEDGVPGSNGPLKHPHTFDVTALKKDAGYAGSSHLWPIEYYRESVMVGNLPFWEPEQKVIMQYPPGGFTVM